MIESLAGNRREVGDVLAFKAHLDLNRAAANFTVLDKLLRAAAGPVQADGELLAAVRAREGIILLNHVLNFYEGRSARLRGRSLQ